MEIQTVSETCVFLFDTVNRLGFWKFSSFIGKDFIPEINIYNLLI